MLDIAMGISDKIKSRTIGAWFLNVKPIVCSGEYVSANKNCTIITAIHDAIFLIGLLRP